MAGIRVEIRAHAIFEVDRLTNVDDGSFVVAIDIASRLGRESGKDSLNLFRNFHREQFYRLSGYLLNSVTFALQSCSNSCVEALKVQ